MLRWGWWYKKAIFTKNARWEWYKKAPYILGETSTKKAHFAEMLKGDDIK